MSFVGAIDQGTSSTRFCLFDHTGTLVDSHQTEFPQYYTKKGENWVEHDPMEILDSVHTCINQVMSRHKAADVVAIGITNQRETTVVWDRRTGKPLHRALVWLDTRSESVVQGLIKKAGGNKDVYRSECGLPLSTYFSGTKLVWLKKNVPAVQKAMEEKQCCFGTIDSWLLYNLTGGVSGGRHITDVTNASRTMLMNLEKGQWSKKMCDAFDLPMHILPEIVSNSEVYGSVSTGSLKGVRVAGCVGDQQSAMVGQLCFDVGSVKNTYGTGCFMLLNTGTRPVASSHGLLTTACFQLGPKQPIVYALEGSVAVAGVAIQWMRDNLGLIKSAAEASELAASVPDAGGMYFVPAFSGLFAPYWRADARGTMCGMTLNTRKAHFARAAIEAVCYRSTEVVKAMQQDSGVEVKMLRVDGGMAVSEPTMQFQADILNIDVERPKVLETTAMGSAVAAGLAVGFWSSVEDVKKCVAGSYTTFQPQMDDKTRAARLKGWNKAVQRALNWDDSGTDEEDQKAS